MSLRNDFGGYDYEATLSAFRFTKRNPNDVRNGETRAEWFQRVHEITGEEFSKIGRAKQLEAKQRPNMGNKNRVNVGLKS